MSTLLTPVHGSMPRREEWLHSTCRSFSRTTGWQLEYLPAAELRDSGNLTQQFDSCWQWELTDGHRPVGLIILQPQPRTVPALPFNSACQLAELIAENINRFLRQQSQVHEQSSEIGMLIATRDQRNHRNRLRALLRAASCLANFRAAALFVLEPDGSAVRLRLGHRLDRTEIPKPRRELHELPPDLQSLQTGPVLVGRESDSQSLWLPASMNSGVCVPIHSDSGPIGTLWLFDRRVKQRDQLPMDLLNGFAQQIADVFERIVLLQDSETYDRMDRELDVIASTTADNREVTETVPGCDVAVRCLSRCKVGGDLCEILPVDEHRTVFVIGDASGDSTPAAMVMTATRGALHALMESRRSRNQPIHPPEIVAELNRAILHVTAAQQFITLLFGVFDGRTRTLEYTNAGHCPPLHIDSGTVTELKSQGLLLGVMEDADYSSDTVLLKPGQQLILFSDGIVEARDLDENMFRNEGILNAIDSRTFKSAAETLRTIWNEYEAHTGGRNLDDRTLMVIRGATSDTGQAAEPEVRATHHVC